MRMRLVWLDSILTNTTIEIKIDRAKTEPFYSNIGSPQHVYFNALVKFRDYIH